jgi:hypothetical protein
MDKVRGRKLLFLTIVFFIKLLTNTFISEFPATVFHVSLSLIYPAWLGIRHVDLFL